MGTHEVKVQLFQEVEPILTVEVTRTSLTPVSAGRQVGDLLAAFGGCAGSLDRAGPAVSCQTRSPHLST